MEYSKPSSCPHCGRDPFPDPGAWHRHVNACGWVTVEFIKEWSHPADNATWGPPATARTPKHIAEILESEGYVKRVHVYSPRNLTL